jgi:hypothetical protein
MLRRGRVDAMSLGFITGIRAGLGSSSSTITELCMGLENIGSATDATLEVESGFFSKKSSLV